MDYPAATLRAIAGVTSITSAVAAYPVAANLFGAVPGAVVLASSAAAIYTGWHVVATSADTDKRVAAGVLAGAFAMTMVAGIHASADLQTAASATSAAKAADALYLSQEQSRMATLADVTAELRATSKARNPAEYADLQAQVDKLSVTTVRQATASQVTNGLFAGGWYSWAVASVFEVVTPALLLLAGMVGRRKQGHVNAVNAPVNAVNSVLTQENQQLAITPETGVNSTVNTPVNAELTPVDPLTALVNRAVTPTTDGYITAEQVVNGVNCTIRQARTAIAKAVDQGALTKTGAGNATRYRYAPQLRAVK